MSNSVVRVRENPIDTSLILVIGEDGLVTPDRATVEEYLKSRNETELRIMQVNKSDGRMVDITVDHMTYVASQKEEVMYMRSKEELDEIAKSLYNFRLDHDYTPFIHSPQHPDLQEIDELDHTLSLLEGSSEPPDLIPLKIDFPLKLPPKKPPTPLPTKLNIPITENTIVTPAQSVEPIQTVSNTVIQQTLAKSTPKTIVEPVKHIEHPKPTQPSKITTELPTVSENAKKAITSHKPTRPPKQASLPKPVKPKQTTKDEVEEDDDEEVEEEEQGDDGEANYSDDDFTMESEESMDDADDSDFEIDEKPKTRTRVLRQSRSKSQSEPAKVTKPVTAKIDETKPPKVEEPPSQPTPPAEKPPDKKVPPKKEKKPPKPLPNDFALFSTPDIIRRVSGKQDASTPTTPNTPPVPAESSQTNKPASTTITTTQETPSKLEQNPKRPSIEKPLHRTSIDNKNKDLSKSNKELKRQKSSDMKPDRNRTSSGRKSSTSKGSVDTAPDSQTETVPSARDIREIIQSENTKSYTSDLVIPDSTNNPNTAIKSEEDEDINLSIHNIDEILFKVAETLADDKEFQSALDKSLDENMHLNSSGSTGELSTSYSDSSQATRTSTTNPVIRGTQVIRSDGRVVVIPPPERPTTRSRNKVKSESSDSSKTASRTPPIKVLDDEHVSGGELDSSSDEDRSDDDPEKLWCICNQPHNNRFMICCDNCEEWYHGKCVNVTKQMGQMMEKEGREWICLYCKDLSLKRPSAAARRIRKASRTSGTESTGHSDSNPGNPTPNPTTVQKVQGCLVCRKPCRNHSIFCSDACIVQNAKDVEKVVVFERSTGKLLSGNEAPTAANLDKWLKKHPGFEVVRSKAANVVKQVSAMPKTPPVKLQVLKDPLHQGVSLALQKRGVHVGLLKHSVKEPVEAKEQPPVPKPQPVSKPQPPQPKPIPKVITESKPIKKLSLVKTAHVSQLVLNPAPIQLLNKKRKSIQKSSIIESQPTTPKEKPKPKISKPKTPVETPLSPEKKEESVRDSVRKSLSEQLTHRIQLQNEIKLDKDEVVKITNEIESQLFKCFGDTGQKYRNKYRSLMFNIKDGKNQTLWRSICQKTVNPYQLVRLSPDDLASQELALWRERENKHQLDMITKNELDQLGRTQPYVIKTHKGEQEVEDNRLNSEIDKTEMVTGLAAERAAAMEADTSDKKSKEKDKKRSRSERDKKYDKKSSRTRDKDRKRDRRSPSRDRNQRRRSRSKSRGSTRHLEKRRSRSRDRYRRSSHKTLSSYSKHKNSPLHSTTTTDKLDKKSKEILENLVDNKIVPPLEDKLWRHVTQEDITTAPVAESDSDHEPTSTVTIPTPPHAPDHEDLNSSTSTPSAITSKEDFNKSLVYPDDEGGLSPPPPRSREVVWSGTINMIDVAEITISAHEVSGDCVGLGDELPPCLDVVGRISPETVWDYISKMKSSNSKAIALLRLSSTSVEAQMPYIALYSYLQSRNRLGVVKSCNKAVKDFYILPLGSQMPIPQALLPLSGPSFEESRPVLLLGIIVRDKRKRPLFVSSTPLQNKRLKLDKPLTAPIVRSYTPPPAVDTAFKSTPPQNKVLVAGTSKESEEDMNEPYSPKDSDPDSVSTNTPEISKSSVHLSSSDLSKILSSSVKSSSFLETPKFIEPFSNKFDVIPGLDTNPTLLANQQLQHEMEVLDQQIAKQKAEIQNMSQNIASSSTSSHSGTALSNIELPRNIQQILDSIKTPQTANPTDGQPITSGGSSDLTIPLILPKINARNGSSTSSSSSIPLNLPRYKSKSSSSNSPSTSETPFDSYNRRTLEQRSVLSSLTDDELVRKANEMMQTVEECNRRSSQGSRNISAHSPVQQPPLPPAISTSSSSVEANLPPIPGLD